MPRAEDRITRRWLLVREILYRYDPADLRIHGCPDDEYDPEVPGVLAAINTASDAVQLQHRIKAVFDQKFGPDSCTDFTRWPQLARELWRLSRTQKW